MKHILVLYNTKTGTTKHAAEEIAAAFRMKGEKATVSTITAAPQLNGFDAVIIGAPINGMRWQLEAIKFVESNQQQLNSLPVAYFFMSYLIGIGRPLWDRKIQNSLNKPSAIVKPVFIGKFTGKAESMFPTPLRLLFGVPKNAQMDRTDDKVIKNWAEECMNLFHKQWNMV